MLTLKKIFVSRGRVIGGVGAHLQVSHTEKNSRRSEDRKRTPPVPAGQYKVTGYRTVVAPPILGGGSWLHLTSLRGTFELALSDRELYSVECVLKGTTGNMELPNTNPEIAQLRAKLKAGHASARVEEGRSELNASAIVKSDEFRGMNLMLDKTAGIVATFIESMSPIVTGLSDSMKKVEAEQRAMKAAQAAQTKRLEELLASLGEKI